MPDLIIPDNQREAWESFLSQSDADASALLDALEATKPQMRVESLVAALSVAQSVELKGLRSIVAMLVSMAHSRATLALSVDEFTARIVELAKKNAKIAPDVSAIETPASTTNWNKVQSTLAKCLVSQSIKITAKALQVFTDHQRILSSIRILSDFRPLIDDDSSEVGALTIVHQLKVSCHNHNGTNRTSDFYVAMDHHDLVKLKATVDRALAKHEGLEHLAQRSGVSILEDDAT